MQGEPHEIREISDEDTSNFWNMIESSRSGMGRDYYLRAFERHQLGELSVIIALKRESIFGFTFLNWQPKYALFRKLGIPEIQDLNVLPVYRKKGIGQSIITFCEEKAQQKGHDTIGIGVGLDSSFGAAQRLYVRLGYIPDGNGVTYDRKPVAIGDFKPIDENLSLMMTKSLKSCN